MGGGPVEGSALRPRPARSALSRALATLLGLMAGASCVAIGLWLVPHLRARRVRHDSISLARRPRVADWRGAEERT
ncbi:hypothetical protein FHX52_0395 [Humibacillus xanthopallidus]|uniref:Uncharacterized protein n=1 Tax=Humibacillus xanthopallidus TaxID=412689 RepID=A0A543PT93_9MICO|nr:hypothetical protein FHX52_0395 [Humibacillus xanthopallidus]